MPFFTIRVAYCVLLLGKLADSLPDCHALRNWAAIIFAILSVKVKQSPNSFTNYASSCGLYYTSIGMLKIKFHPRAIASSLATWQVFNKVTNRHQK
jgi:hypothetical protein